MSILLVNTCAEKLHYLEFVKPVEGILKKAGLNFFSRHYSEISDDDLRKAERIIICGTSLKDNKFIEEADKFGWIEETDKPILGICAGMQMIGIVFNGALKRKTEIGFYT
jgi:GMP synthase (glutamine-hydrolysing)